MQNSQQVTEAPVTPQSRAQLEALKAQLEALQHRPSPEEVSAQLVMDQERLSLQKKEEVMGGVGAIILLFPLVIAISIRILRRGQRGAAPAANQALENDRLARLEQAVDAIAFEVERIGESQRFQTKLMSEKLPAGEIRSPGRVKTPV